MRKLFISVAAGALLLGSFSSCIGSFSLTNKLLAWNKTIDNKFVNELVFVAFLIVPVYEVSALADILVINSIEFWSGESPIAQSKSVIEGNDGKYLVERDSNGYTITSLDDQSSVRLDFDMDTQTWSVLTPSGEDYPVLCFVDDSHVKVNVGGEMMLVEKSEAGLMACRQAVSAPMMAIR